MVRPIPPRPRKPQSPAQQPLVRPPLQQQRPIRTKSDPDRPLPRRLRRLGRLARQLGCNAHRAGLTHLHQRADPASRVPGRADRRPQIHHALGKLARPDGRRYSRRRRHKPRLRSRKRLCNSEKPRHHPLHIPVHHHRRLIKRNRRNRRSRIRPDPRQSPQRRQISRELSPMPRHHRPRASHQVPRPGVVAKPRPFRHHRRILGLRQRLDIRPKRGEPQEIAFHRRHRRLLQHHFRQPHPIRIGPNAPRHSPRQHPRMHVVPAQQCRTYLSVTQSLCPLPRKDWPHPAPDDKNSRVT